jgi:hypothetical protein
MAPPPFRWCVVMSDTRADDSLGSFWQLTTAVNRQYAAAHGYGFLHVQLRYDSNRSGSNGTNAGGAPSPKLADACVHRVHGARASPWCKILVVAHAALHGVLGRRCSRWLASAAQPRRDRRPRFLTPRLPGRAGA